MPQPADLFDDVPPLSYVTTPFLKRPRWAVEDRSIGGGETSVFIAGYTGAPKLRLKVSGIESGVVEEDGYAHAAEDVEDALAIGEAGHTCSAMIRGDSVIARAPVCVPTARCA